MGKGRRRRVEAYRSHEAAKRAGPPGSRSRAGGAAAKTAGIAKALGDLRGGRKRVMVDVQGSTEASRSAGQGGGRTSRCWRWSSWSSRRMSSAVFSVAAAIASRRGGFGFGCAGGWGTGEASGRKKKALDAEIFTGTVIRGGVKVSRRFMIGWCKSFLLSWLS